METKTKPKRHKYRMNAETSICRLDSELVRKARVVAAIRNVTIVRLIDEILTGPLDRAYSEYIRDGK